MFPLQLPFSAQSRVIAAASALGLPSSRLIFHARTAFESHLLQVTRRVVLTVFQRFIMFLSTFSQRSLTHFFRRSKTPTLRSTCRSSTPTPGTPHIIHLTLFLIINPLFQRLRHPLGWRSPAHAPNFNHERPRCSLSPARRSPLPRSRLAHRSHS
jgi:hypothetical protein